MKGAEHLSRGREHRWFHLSANNETQGGIKIAVTLPKNSTSVITLLGVDLKDADGKPVSIDSLFPASIELRTGKPLPIALSVGIAIAVAVIAAGVTWFRFSGAIRHQGKKL